MQKNGSRDALDGLYRLTSRSVYFTCLKLLKNENDAKDAAQDTFLTAMRSLKTLSDGAKFPMWINSIAVNRCRQQFRAVSELSLDEQREQGFDPEDEGFIPEDYVTDKAKRRIIMDIIDNKLSDVQRQTVILYYFNEMNISEIASLMGCPEGTVGYRLSCSRKILKEAVLIYEKENNDRLHAAVPVVPVLTQLLKAEADATAVPELRPWAANAQPPAAQTPAVNNISDGGRKAMFATIKGKIVAAVTALVVVGGGITAAVVLTGDDTRSRNYHSGE